MRFMIMHKTNADWEAGAVPSADLIARVGAMIGELVSAGILLAGEGLRATSQGVRLRFRGGERTVTPGPFPGQNELPAGYSILRVASLDEAVEWASRFAEIVGDVEIDIRPLTEEWDLGTAPKPANLTTRRYMAMHKADAASEAGTTPTPEQRTAMARLHEEMARAGVLLASEAFAPSAKARRIRMRGPTGTSTGERVVLDGPFAESKELIAGFVLVNVSSLDEAMRWADRYVDAVGCTEVDVRLLADGP